MAIYLGLVMFLVPLVAGLESFLTRHYDPRGIAILIGINIGGMIWNACAYWVVFPLFSYFLILLVLAQIIRMIFDRPGAVEKSVLAAVVTTVGLFLGWNVFFSTMVMNSESNWEKQILNPTVAEKTALIVYHPGRSGFPGMIHQAFAEALAEEGWRVEIFTANSQAPTDLKPYDLLVLGTPTYNWLPSKRMQDYLRSLEDLKKMPTVVIVSAEGYTSLSQSTMEGLVSEANGVLVKSFGIKTGSNNIDGLTDPQEIMRQAAIDVEMKMEALHYAKP